MKILKIGMIISNLAIAIWAFIKNDTATTNISLVSTMFWVHELGQHDK